MDSGIDKVYKLDIIISVGGENYVEKVVEK